jgi:putative addiction module killer protein
MSVPEVRSLLGLIVLPMGIREIEPVGEGISELRIHYGPGYRVYFQKRGSTIIVLLCSGDKGTQKKDIATAKRLAKEWSE